MPAAEGGAIAKKAPRTSEGRAVVVPSEEEEEEEEEEEDVEVVAEGNRPAEIVKWALEVGELDADETVDRWFTDTREAGDLAHDVHGVVVVRLTLRVQDVKGLPQLPYSWQDVLPLDVNAQAQGVIAVDSRPFLHGPMPMQCPTPFSLLLCLSLWVSVCSWFPLV